MKSRYASCVGVGFTASIEAVPPGNVNVKVSLRHVFTRQLMVSLDGFVETTGRSTGRRPTTGCIAS
jgi:hypothetical protein